MKAFLTGALALAFPCMAIAQIAVLQIKVLEGEGVVHAPGARVPRPLTVQVTDENGQPVPAAAVSFQLPPEGPSGIFSNGLRTDLVLTDANGRAAVRSVQLNRAAGPFRIRITAVKEQARAGMVSVQYIGENQAAPQTAGTKPAANTHRSAAESGEITPTTARMGPGSRKKWYVLAAIAVGGGAAFLGVSRAANSHGSTAPSSVVSMGTPTISVGHP